MAALSTGLVEATLVDALILPGGERPEAGHRAWNAVVVDVAVVGAESIRVHAVVAARGTHLSPVGGQADTSMRAIGTVWLVVSGGQLCGRPAPQRKFALAVFSDGTRFLPKSRPIVAISAR